MHSFIRYPLNISMVSSTLKACSLSLTNIERHHYFHFARQNCLDEVTQVWVVETAGACLTLKSRHSPFEADLHWVLCKRNLIHPQRSLTFSLLLWKIIFMSLEYHACEGFVCLGCCVMPESNNVIQCWDFGSLATSSSSRGARVWDQLWRH
jgi:hypothetical protein